MDVETQSGFPIGYVVMGVGVVFGALFLGRRRIGIAARARRWIEAFAVVVVYCLIIAGPFALGAWLAPNPGRAPMVVINLLIVGVCVDGIIRRLRNKNGA